LAPGAYTPNINQGNKTMSNWTPIADNKVRHVWANEDGKEITVDPTFYAESGTPIDEETGDDLTYVRTEILA